MNRLLTTLLFLGLCTHVLLAQKVIIYFDDAFLSSPSVSKAALKYNKDFAYSFTFDDATSDAFTHALPLFQGGKVQNTTLLPLYFTDGCGNNISFKAGIAWNTANPMGIDVHTGNVAEQLTWKQLDTLYDVGWDVLNHTYSHKNRFDNLTMLPSDYINEIVKNQTAVKANTRKKIEMPVFVVPSGDDLYQNVAFDVGHKIVFDQSANTIGMGGLGVNGDFNLNNLKIHRQLLGESVNNITNLDKVATKSSPTNPIWYNEFTHRIDQTVNGVNTFDLFKTYMQRVANTWGKNGTDRLWMASLQEVFDYIVFRQTVKYTSQVVGKTLEINFDLSQVPTWLRRKCLTLMVNSNTLFNRVDVPPTVIKTFNGVGTTKIVNLDFSIYTGSTHTQDLANPSVFHLFPNPASDILTIQPLSEMAEMCEITLTDASGKILKAARFSSKSYDLDVKMLPAGLYFMSLKQGGSIFTDKFIKK
jgi:Secretion system C-terminal sorting domain/Polysaccharide deacetylase